MAFSNLWCIIPLASYNTETGSLYTITLNRGETIFGNDVSPHLFGGLNMNAFKYTRAEGRFFDLSKVKKRIANAIISMQEQYLSQISTDKQYAVFCFPFFCFFKHLLMKQ